MGVAVHRWLLIAAIAASGLALACTSAPAASPKPAAAPAASAERPAAAPAAPAPASAAAPAPARAAVEPVTLRVTDQQITSSAGHYIGSRKGYYREEGIELDFVRATARDLFPMLASGQVDIAAGGISASMFNAFARGVNVKMVADHGGNLAGASAGGFVVRKDLVDSGAYQRPADLKGRKVAINARGQAPEIALDRFLAGGGLTLDDIELIEMAFPDTLQALEQRALDAAYYQEPFTTIGIDRGVIVRGPIGHDLYPDQQIAVIFFGQRMLGDQALAMRYMRAYVRGVRDYVKAMRDRDPAAFDEVVPILIEHTTVKDRALFEKAIPSGLKADPLPNVQSIVDDQEWYLAHGYQTTRVNVRDFLDTSFVEQAIRELGPAR